METAAVIAFFASLFLLVVLFALKRVEVVRGARIAEPLRASADRGALRVKSVLGTVESHIENIPFFVGALTRYGVHIGALSFARLARLGEREAHRLADLVSHKRGFERRETKSKYLKEVSGYKEGGDGPVASE